MSHCQFGNNEYEAQGISARLADEIIYSSEELKDKLCWKLKALGDTRSLVDGWKARIRLRHDKSENCHQFHLNERPEIIENFHQLDIKVLANAFHPRVFALSFLESVKENK